MGIAAADRLIEKDCQLIARLRTELFAEKTVTDFRVKAGHFSRRPILTLQLVVILILRGHQMSQQNALNKVFRELELLDQLPTGAAYCQARQKLRPDLFVHLNSVTVEEFTRLSEEDGTLQSWHERRMLGADGTRLNMPDTEALREAFTVTTNGPEKVERVQGFGMVLYDLLHDVAVGAHLGPIAGEPELLITELWPSTREGDVIALDRAYVSYALIALAIKQGRDLIIRCRGGQSFKAVDEFRESNETQRFVTLNCPTKDKTRRFVRREGLRQSIRVRLLRFELPSGETEILMTTLCDSEEYPAEEIYEAYGWRWREESYFDRVKNIFDIERFSGMSVRAVEQDFYGVLFLATLESTLAQSAQSALDEAGKGKELKLRPQVNRAVSYVALLDYAVQLLADPEIPLEDVVAQLHRLLQTNPKRHPPKRKVERPPRSPARSLYNLRYRKRITA
jgi:Transposase DDE domain